MSRIFSTFYHDKHDDSTLGFIFHNFPANLEECKMMGKKKKKKNFFNFFSKRLHLNIIMKN